MKLIAITGGIGSGKSIVSRILQANGYDVYDCDREAKRIMQQDCHIHSRLNSEVHNEAVVNGNLNNRLIAQIVFNNPEKLQALNSIVHQYVREDIVNESLKRHPGNCLFIETAILYQSQLDKMVDEVWEVVAPRTLRIARVMKRNAITHTEVEARIDSQDSYQPQQLHYNIKKIVNDGVVPLLPQIINFIPKASL